MSESAIPRDQWAAWLEHLAARQPPFGAPFNATIREVIEGYCDVILAKDRMIDDLTTQVQDLEIEAGNLDARIAELEDELGGFR